MKTSLMTATVLLSAALAAAGPPPDMQGKLDEFVGGGPGGVAVAWVDSDGTAFLQSGRLSADDARPITPDTQFELGSVTKVFTALLLAESERQGRVSRLDPAAKYLLPPGDPDQAALAKITLLSLTTHTSGLPRLPSNIGAKPDANPDPYAAYDRGMLVAALRADGAAAPAGRMMAYSNFGAAVLGEALGSAWATTYADALREHVLLPLGMKATSLALAGERPPAGLAPAHDAAGRPVPNWTAQAFAPAGALMSCARDMAHFLSACTGRTRSPLRGAIEETLKPQHEASDGGQVGLGWMLTDDADNPVAWHNGATAGTHTFVAFGLKSGRAVAILSNMQRPSEGLGFGLLGAPPPRPRAATVRDAASYCGRYPLSPVFAIDVREVNGGLVLQATGQGALGLRETGPDRFAVAGVVAEVTFERDAAGAVQALVLHQNGRDLRGPRGPLPPPPATVNLPPETLREYAGSYPLFPAFVITVTEEGGGLFAQATGQPRFQVFASARDEFFYKVVDARISFTRDASGRVGGLVLHQGGQDLAAKRAAP